MHINVLCITKGIIKIYSVVLKLLSINKICFCGSIYINLKTLYLGAGKHPSPLDILESYSPDLYLKVGFYLIKKYCSCPKLSQFKDRAFLWLVPAPIYTCCDVSDDIHIKDLARAPEIVPKIFNFFNFFDFFSIFSIFFARTVYITIQSDRVYRYIPIYL